MPIDEKQVIMCTCSVCGESWLPKRCSACKSPLWNGGEDKRGRKKAPLIKEPKQEKLPAKINRQSLANSVPNTTIGMPGSDGKCPHKKMKGELCYKCDAKFGMPKIKTGA